MTYKAIREKLSPHLVPASILVLVTVAVYLRVLGHDFQLFWDDEKYVTANAAVQGLTLEHLKMAFTTNYMGNYAPLQIVSYMLDYSLWGMKASGFFMTNILLHAANGVLFYAILMRLGWKREWACICALLFLLHPVQVESVAWISERKNLLAMVFSLSAFYSYLIYRVKGWGRGKIAYGAAFVLFSMALLSKAVAVIIPLVLVLYDFCYVEKRERSRWQADKIPFAIAAIVITWLTIQFQAPGDVPGAGGGRVPWHGGSPYATFLTMLTVLPRYLGLLFWPVNLSAVYDPPLRTGFDMAVLGGSLICLLLILAGIMLFNRGRKLFFWYGLFFIGLLPVSQVIPLVTLMNDRYLYFPMLGAAAFLGGIATALFDCGGGRRHAAAVWVGVALITLPCLSFARAGVWKNDLTLWNDAAKKAPNHFIALYGKAQALQNGGDLDGALPLYQQVLAMRPRHLDTLTHIAMLYGARNMPLAARPYLVDVTRYYPRLARGFMDLGMNYYQTGDLADSENSFRRGLELQPGSRETLMYLGLISLRTHRVDDARDYFKKLVSLGGADSDVEYNLACAEALGGHPGEALRHLEIAMRLGFRDFESLAKDHDLDSIRALPDFQKVVNSFPGSKR